MKTIKKYRNTVLRALDIIIITVSYCIARVVVNEISSFSNLANTIILAILIYSTILSVCRTYKNITRYENGYDYLVYVFACFVSYSLVTTVGIIFPYLFAPLRITSVAALIIVTSIIGYRVLARLWLNGGYNDSEENSDIPRKNVLIIGAGDATKTLLSTIKNTSMKENYNVVGLIDDNTYKVNYAISGNRILGTRNDISKICEEKEVEIILFTISNISSEERKQILNICYDTGCKVRILPGTKDLIKSKNILENFRDVEIEDLLGRDTIKLDNEKIGELIKEKVVLVTGGGGSIGSELCRQIASFKPENLVIVDIYENNLYDIEQELRFTNSDVKVSAIVASVRDKKRLDEIFEKYKPYLVFHAAAHKHVPLMEKSPLEAVKNNVFGTYNVMKCADEHKVKKCILISTDKAVNPTNIMGATKRLCEMIVQAINKESKTEYAAVRFGNVLGSNGSVIPLFKKQIKNGGPITVTHKEITRFFMTIPEAVSLVLQAMSYAKGGEIFVLDMGEPVKIYDMAQKLIKLMGYVPNVDIEIKVTGLRPGEKLYEELLMNEEGLEATKHEKIHIAEPLEIKMEEIEEKLTSLKELIDGNNNDDKEKIKKTMKQIVPTYKEPDEVNNKITENGTAEEKKDNTIVENEVSDTLNIQEKEVVEEKEDKKEEIGEMIDNAVAMVEETTETENTKNKEDVKEENSDKNDKIIPLETAIKKGNTATKQKKEATA